MELKIEVLGHIATYFPAEKGRSFTLQLDRSLSVTEILKNMGVNPHLVSVVMVNGERKEKSFLPGDGAVITLMSPPAGG